jgi:hypothetical protein
VDAEDAQYRAGRVVVVLSHDETCELRVLFSQIAHTCDVAYKTLGAACPPPAGSEFQRFKELMARLNAAVERVNAIVS